MIELDKVRKRVAEFAEYGELEMMVQYVNDVRAVQKRLADAQDNINFINKVSCCSGYKDLKMGIINAGCVTHNYQGIQYL